MLNELRLVDLKIDDKSQPCLMTCYLDYNKMGDIETLTGTYSSRNMKTSSDCGNGKVYLEKSPVSDFYKEDFLVKREEEQKKKAQPRKSVPAKITQPKKPVAKAPAPKKATVKPGAEDNLVTQKAPEPPLPVAPPATLANPGKDSLTKVTEAPPVIKKIPKPEILRKRDNELVKTITTNVKEFTIDLYDNGEIDGDRISVYHNNELIVSNKTLTDKPISFTIKADENAPIHEFVMVAENLGTIPPNTALMIITAGGKRYELFVTSTEQKNAVVRVEYKP